MKKLSFFIFMIVLLGVNDAKAQWTTNGVHIYNTNTGNVGIGNNSPSSLLYVGKNMTEPTITVRNLGGIGGATYTMMDDASGANWKFKATSTGGFKIRDHASGLDVFFIEQNATANLLYLKSGGRIGIGTSTPDNSALVDMSSTDKGFLPPRMTYAELMSIPNPANGLLVFCTNCGSNGSGNMSMFMAGMWYILSANCMNPLPPVEGTHVPSETQIIWNWNAASGASGYKWNTTNDYATALDMSTGTSKTETGLTSNTSYTRYVWSYNACGNSAAVALTSTTSFTCGNSIIIDHVAGAVAPVNKTVTYGTVTNIPGETSKCWITKNLGADNQATSKSDNTEAAAGWYWQFNRLQGYKHDGTTRTPNTTWITSISEDLNWQTANDPCTIELGTGWRLPTLTEWTNVDASGGWNEWNGPWNSALKMHAAGGLDVSDGSLNSRGSSGRYWSSSQLDNSSGWRLNFSSASCYMLTNLKAFGFSSRCLQDQ